MFAPAAHVPRLHRIFSGESWVAKLTTTVREVGQRGKVMEEKTHQRAALALVLAALRVRPSPVQRHQRREWAT
jgi:hypothetical protein